MAFCCFWQVVKASEVVLNNTSIMRADTIPAPPLLVMPSDSTTVTADSTAANQENDEDDSGQDPPPPTTKRWTYNFSLTGDFKTGNVQRKLLTTALFFDYTSTKNALGIYTNPRFSKGSINGEKVEGELFVDMNATLFYNTHNFYILVFGVYESSNLRKINHRLVGGYGLGIRLIGGIHHPNPKVQLSVTNAILHEETDFVTNQDVNLWRNSTRLKLTAKLFKNKATFSGSTFVQPALNASYLRWSSITSLAFHLSKHIAFVTTLINSYESLVVIGAKNTDITWTFGLSFSNQ